MLKNFTKCKRSYVFEELTIIIVEANREPLQLI